MTATSHATHRPGLTLTEALVAMFVAAIGLLALLTLFPLGALQMGQALKDERTGQTALQADALMRYYWKAGVTEPTGVHGFPDGPDPFVHAFTRPNVRVFEITDTPTGNPESYVVSASQNPNLAGTPPIYLNIYSSNFARPTPGPGVLPLVPEPQIRSDQPSFPVVIDPLGWHPLEGRPYAQKWLGGRPGFDPKLPGFTQDTLPLPLPRRTLRAFQNLTAGAYNPANSPACATPPWGVFPGPAGAFMYGQNAPPVPLRNPLRFCALLDDLTYDESGSGVPPPAGPVERQGRYNWMAVVQQPRVSDPFTANLTLCVFDGRAAGYAKDDQELMYPRDSGIPAPGNSPTATLLPNIVVFVPGSTNLRVYYQGDKPPITKGRWVMDGTLGGFRVTDTGPAGSQIYDPDNASAVWAAAPPQLPLRHGNFYRVATATEGIDLVRNSATYLDIELEKPIKPRSDGNPGFYSGTLYALPGLAEVFEMPQLTR